MPVGRGLIKPPPREECKKTIGTRSTNIVQCILKLLAQALQLDTGIICAKLPANFGLPIVLICIPKGYC